MCRRSSLSILACMAALFIAGCSANVAGVSPAAEGPAAGATPVLDGHTLAFMPTRSSAKPSVSGITIPYGGGPLLVDPKIYIIFWGYKRYGDPDKVAPLLKEYVKVMGGSGHNNIYTQYYQGTSSDPIYVTNPKGQLGGVWYDDTDAVPEQPNDPQVAAESLLGVQHFGYDASGSYVVATPHGRSTVGFGTQFCAYHSDIKQGSELVSYTNFPYIPDAGANCGAYFTQNPKDESGEDEGVTITEGHEEGEAVTDADVGTGWYSFKYGEIGDACAWRGIETDKFGKESYVEQPMYSNASESCVQTYAKSSR